LYNGVGEKTDRKEYKKNNFDMPLQWYSALRQENKTGHRDNGSENRGPFAHAHAISGQNSRPWLGRRSRAQAHPFCISRYSCLQIWHRNIRCRRIFRSNLCRHPIRQTLFINCFKSLYGLWTISEPPEFNSITKTTDEKEKPIVMFSGTKSNWWMKCNF
jgi:hypothetical protein